MDKRMVISYTPVAAHIFGCQEELRSQISNSCSLCVMYCHRLHAYTAQRKSQISGVDSKVPNRNFFD